MQTAQTPERVLALYDRPMWDFLKEEGQLRLQCCSDCGTWRYPPGPVCQECLSPEYEWKPVSGEAKIVSWVIFHREYLPEYPARYSVVAVRLTEGPIVISNLVEDPPEGAQLIGCRVRLQVVNMEDGVALPRFELE